MYQLHSNFKSILMIRKHSYSSITDLLAVINPGLIKLIVQIDRLNSVVILQMKMFRLTSLKMIDILLVNQAINNSHLKNVFSKLNNT